MSGETVWMVLEEKGREEPEHNRVEVEPGLICKKGTGDVRSGPEGRFLLSGRRFVQVSGGCVVL